MGSSDEKPATFSSTFARLANHVLEDGYKIRPTIVLLHGGWNGPETFSILMPRLEKAGYSVYAPALPSSGTVPALPNFDEDVKVIHCTVKSLINSGKDVVLVMHSYSAVPGCEALQNLEDLEGDQVETDQYKRGKVVKLVFLAGMVLPVGDAVWSMSKDYKVPGFEIHDNLISVLDAPTRFYNDLDPKEAVYWHRKMKPQSRMAYASRLTYPAYKHYPCAYLYTTRDMALPFKKQEEYVARAGIKETAKVDAGHAPHRSQPLFVEKFIRRCAGEEISLL